ncbi:threonylcarbamoyl-AMP synthase [Alkalibacter rhizosphaerae]|uniref:Threonylcarbamoyl-AMP synthase n=1 Tax=Alkalibacter rhizosphaerae TaxID=2815577 RepID=A0A975AI53_9FIRM|nr:L-threonylcarbamoyladenylate synthase [Alkalibacter rhizosphaerae]QSX09319.1 threonylcarbamoyl-AMP synthase [Alkalibacter rhizosphaerae]
MTRIIYMEEQATTLDKDNKIYEEKILQEAAAVIQSGGTVVFPTETVYGLGANGLDPVAVKKIYQAKGRPGDNPMILHISSMDMLERVTNVIPEVARKLMDTFWPGPLTLVLKKGPQVPLEATGGLETVAVRMPSHAMAKKLIQLANTPIAAPSANLSGKPSPTTAAHVVEDLDGRVDVILAADQAAIGLESTVVDTTGPIPVLLRPGSITLTQLKNVVGQVLVDKGVTQRLAEGETARSPGMKYRHYAPDGDMILVKGTIPGVIYTMMDWMEKRKEDHPVALVPTEYLSEFAGWDVLDMGPIAKPEVIMNRLYQHLRTCNQKKATFIVAPLFAEEDDFLAVNNRLSKAAGYHIVPAMTPGNENREEE